MFLSKIEVHVLMDVRNSKSGNMTSFGKDGVNIRIFASPK